MQRRSQRQTLVRLFNATLIAWLLVAVLAAVASGRWMALIALPAAAILFMTGCAERLTQTMQLAWPVLLLPGATFAFIGVMQALGYGQMDGEPAVSAAAAKAVFFAAGLLLHFVAFALLATEARAADHPGGECARELP